MSKPMEVDLETASGTVYVGRAYIKTRRGTTTTNFAYDHAYLALPTSYAIDPGAFADASPDRWGRHIISKRLQAEARRLAVSPRTLTNRDFLLRVSDKTRQGALRFRMADGPQGPRSGWSRN